MIDCIMRIIYIENEEHMKKIEKLEKEKEAGYRNDIMNINRVRNRNRADSDEFRDNGNGRIDDNFNGKLYNFILGLSEVF